LEEERHQHERLELLLVAQAAEQQAARQRAAEQRAAQHRAAEQQASQPQALQQQAVQPHAVLGAQVAQPDCVLELPKPNDGNLPKPNDGNRIVTSELVQENAKPPSVDPVAQLASSKVSAPFTSDRLLSLPVIFTEISGAGGELALSYGHAECKEASVASDGPRRSKLPRHRRAAKE
jgi:hypothetical protein